MHNQVPACLGCTNAWFLFFSTRNRRYHLKARTSVIESYPHQTSTHERVAVKLMTHAWTMKYYKPALPTHSSGWRGALAAKRQVILQWPGCSFRRCPADVVKMGDVMGWDVINLYIGSRKKRIPFNRNPFCTLDTNDFGDLWSRCILSIR